MNEPATDPYLALTRRLDALGPIESVTLEIGATPLDAEELEFDFVEEAAACLVDVTEPASLTVVWFDDYEAYVAEARAETLIEDVIAARALPAYLPRISEDVLDLPRTDPFDD